MKIALASMDQTWEDKAENLRKCESFFQQSSTTDVDLLVFPEMTLTGFSMNAKTVSEHLDSSESLKHMRELAAKYRIATVFGLASKSNAKFYNSAISIDNKGKTLGHYNKIHLFSFGGEDRVFSPGEQITSIKYFEKNIGITICYDLRFPEIYSALSKNCEIIINIANWPASRILHWETLLRARAIENQVTMVGVNRVGIDGNSIQYISSSKVYLPNGGILNPLFQSEEFAVYDLGGDELPKLPWSVRSDRKINLYKEIL